MSKLLLPCRICRGTPTPKKRLFQMVGYTGLYTVGLRSYGRHTRFVCECGIESTETLKGVKDARALWNDENLDAHLKRQLIEATK
jgi:hypothetical protein